jgi:hypothetical protein
MNDPRGIQTHDHSFEDDGRIPNNPTLPLLVYPQALSEAEREASRCRALLAENGRAPGWTASSPTTITTRSPTKSCAWWASRLA